MRKKVSSLAYLILISVFAGCGSNDAIFQVETFTDFQISLGLNTVEAHYFINPNVPVTLRTQLDILNLPESDISQVVANEAFLYPKFNDNVSLEFIHDVNIFIVDPENTNRRKEIFYREAIPAGQHSEIQLFSSITDVTEFMLDDKMIVETRLEFRQFPPATFDVRVDMKFGVYVE
ncbi:MAG: hypothetical protein KJO29_02295 [Bacteroidia bacterium]|nr:hypothetical protein [Bacteroidia bacterium]